MRRALLGGYKKVMEPDFRKCFFFDDKKFFEKKIDFENFRKKLKKLEKSRNFPKFSKNFRKFRKFSESKKIRKKFCHRKKNFFENPAP